MRTLDQQLAEAAAAGDAQRVEQLIADGADVCLPGPGGVTPLMSAAEAGSAACVAALLQAGAPWNAQDEDGYCAGAYAPGGCGGGGGLLVGRTSLHLYDMCASRCVCAGMCAGCGLMCVLVCLHAHACVCAAVCASARVPLSFGMRGWPLFCVPR